MSFGGGGEHCKQIHRKEVMSENFDPGGCWWILVMWIHPCHSEEETYNLTKVREHFMSSLVDLGRLGVVKKENKYNLLMTQKFKFCK